MRSRGCAVEDAQLEDAQLAGLRSRGSAVEDIAVEDCVSRGCAVEDAVSRAMRSRG